MSCLLSAVVLALVLSLPIRAQNTFYGEYEYECPQYWIRFQGSCYHFIKSPLRPREEARKNCQAFQSDLLTINSVDEHGFILQQLQWQDPQHRQWYTGIKQLNGIWVNEADSTSLLNLDNAFLPEPKDIIVGRDYLTYSYNNNLQRWGFEKVKGTEPLLYICEAPISNLRNLVEDDRTYEYGIEIDDPLKIPRGPYFIKQPTNIVFDASKTRRINDVSLSCLAGGYPTPTYEWFREDYEDDRLVAKQIEPLLDSRYTVSGGMLIIYNPTTVKIF